LKLPGPYLCTSITFNWSAIQPFNLNMLWFVTKFELSLSYFKVGEQGRFVLVRPCLTKTYGSKEKTDVANWQNAVDVRWFCSAFSAL